MGGGEGAGFSGAPVKDTWTTPEGVGSRVGSGDSGGAVGAVGENGYNCT